MVDRTIELVDCSNQRVPLRQRAASRSTHAIKVSSISASTHLCHAWRGGVVQSGALGSTMGERVCSIAFGLVPSRQNDQQQRDQVEYSSESLSVPMIIESQLYI